MCLWEDDSACCGHVAPGIQSVFVSTRATPLFTIRHAPVKAREEMLLILLIVVQQKRIYLNFMRSEWINSNVVSVMMNIRKSEFKSSVYNGHHVLFFTKSY